MLAGQSNMSGQGGVENRKWDGVVPSECNPNPKILKLNASLKWEEAKEPLHDGIDTRAVEGVGPGIAFAHFLLNRNPTLSSVGLVPCAISATAILQWQKGQNLYNQLVNRAKASLSGGGSIKALLWYQGESDTGTVAQAQAYKARLQRFILDLRSDLGLPNLLVVVVSLYHIYIYIYYVYVKNQNIYKHNNIITTSAGLQVALASGIGPGLDIVRAAQVNVGLPNVKTVDAKGLKLKSDNLHLTTASQVILGGKLANVI